MPQTLVLDKEKAGKDNNYFSEKLLNYTSFNYQFKIDWSKIKILIRGGRRTGKDTDIVNKRIIPFMWTWWCPVRKKFIPKPFIGVYAPGWEEADNFMDILRDAIEGTPLEKSIVINNKFEIKLSNGSRLICRIANKLAKGKRGRGFDLLYFTESEYISDEDYAAIRPSRLVGSAPEILAGSPNGDDNFPARAEVSGLYDVYVWKTSFSPLIDPKELADEKKLMTDIEWRQEFNAERISGAGQAIPNVLIEHMYKNKGLQVLEKAIPEHIYVGGVDLARRRDKATMYILDVEFPDCTIVFYHEYSINKDDPKFYIKLLDSIIHNSIIFNLSKLRIDQTGMGDMPTVELKRVMAEKNSTCFVEGVDFTYAFKQKWEGLINQSILKFERHEIYSPFIKQLIVQLKSLRWNSTKKLYDFRGPSPDHVMGLFLAMSCIAKVSHYYGTASNKAPETNKLAAEEIDNLKDKIESGYAPKASEIGP